MKSVLKIFSFPFTLLLPLSFILFLIVYNGHNNTLNDVKLKFMQIRNPFLDDNISSEKVELKESFCRNNVEVLEKQTTTTNKHKKHAIEFSSKFRNPCWYEEYDASDVEALRNNPYLSVKKRRTIKSGILQLAQIYEERLSRNRTVRLRCLPAFHIIGQVKCGTTDLYQRLSKHPQIHMGVMKEPDWWTRARFGIYQKLRDGTKVPFSSFTDLFGMAAIKLEDEKIKNCLSTKDIDENGLNGEIQCSQSLIGDASVATFSDDTYLKSSDSPSNLDEHSNSTTANFMKWLLPNAKIIVLVREPVARLYSDYLFFHDSSDVSQEDFHKRVVYSLRVFRRCELRFGSHCCLRQHSIRSQLKTNVHFGLYSVYLREWLRVFPKEQLLIVRMEDYASDTSSTLRKIYQFLEICDPPVHLENVILSNHISNYGIRKIGPMFNETRILLEEFYTKFNQDLAQLLNDDRYLWTH